MVINKILEDNLDLREYGKFCKKCRKEIKQYRKIRAKNNNMCQKCMDKLDNY